MVVGFASRNGLVWTAPETAHDIGEFTQDLDVAAEGN